MRDGTRCWEERKLRTKIASYQAVWMTVFNWDKVKEVEDATKRLKVLEII